MGGIIPTNSFSTQNRMLWPQNAARALLRGRMNPGSCRGSTFGVSYSWSSKEAPVNPAVLTRKPLFPPWHTAVLPSNTHPGKQHAQHEGLGGRQPSQPGLRLATLPEPPRQSWTLSGLSKKLMDPGNSTGNKHRAG